MEKDEKNLKGLSKAIYILAKIGKIMVTVAIPFIAIAMILVAFVMRKIDYRENTIYFDNEKVVTMNETIDGIEFDFNNDFGGKGMIKITLDQFDETTDGLIVKKFFDENKISLITAYIEISLIFAIGVLVIARMILMHLEKLFKNINEKSPFTEENTEHIRMMAKLMLLNICVSIAMNFLLQLVAKSNLSLKFSSFNVVETLIMFSMYYIFKYGTKLQNKSKVEIYGGNNE